MRRTVTLAVTLAVTGILLTALAACNTVQGVGRDIESVGSKGKEVIN